MKKAFLAFLALFVFILISSMTFSNEALHYKVTYKWGLVDKQAGTAVLSIKPTASGYATKLTARTDPWADKFYRLRDTLIGSTDKNLNPSIYTKIAHEKGKYDKDIVKFIRSGSNVKGKCYRYRVRKGGSKTDSLTLNASGVTIDMLTAFYYMRSLNYADMNAGQTVDLNIFSGKKCERLHINYRGRETIEIGDTKVSTYRITFTFTMGSKKKSSDDMDAWISMDQRHIPLKLEGKLPVGKVRCFYTGG